MNKINKIDFTGLENCFRFELLLKFADVILKEKTDNNEVYYKFNYFSYGINKNIQFIIEDKDLVVKWNSLYVWADENSKIKAYIVEDKQEIELNKQKLLIEICGCLYKLNK